MRPFLILLSILLLTSCESEKELKDYSPLLEQILVTPEGSMRGNSIGDPAETIRQNETAPLSDESDHYLYYSGTLNETGNYIISYYFDEEGMYEANLDVYFSDSLSASELYAALIQYLSDKYGPETGRSGMKIWQSEEGRFPGEISVNKEFQDEGSSYVTVSLLEQE